MLDSNGVIFMVSGLDFRAVFSVLALFCPCRQAPSEPSLLWFSCAFYFVKADAGIVHPGYLYRLITMSEG